MTEKNLLNEKYSILTVLRFLLLANLSKSDH